MNAGVAMTYTYDKGGRLSTATQTVNPAETSTYFYDSRNRLVSRVLSHASAPKTTILYIYDLDDHLIAETDEYGASRREYIWIGDTPVAVIDNISTAWPQTYSVHVDHLMRPARLTDLAGTWVWDVIYKPFGETAFLYANPVVFDARFPGQWFQLETGLAYNWNRHYDASLGRYVQPDLLGLNTLMREGPSLYGYVRQSPLAYVDLQGQNSIAIGGWIGASIGGPVGGIAGAIVGGVGGYLTVKAWISKSDKFPPGYWAGDEGAKEWGRRDGCGPEEGKRRFHQKIKGGDRTSRPTDEYAVNPNTGDVIDAEGEDVGRLGDVGGKKWTRQK